jgi:subtilisin family serine protease
MIALKIGRFALHAFVLGLLGACAGGGGGGGGTVPVSPPPPPPTISPLAPPHAPGDYPSASGAEFNASWGPAGTNAQIAWQNGATGAGIVVGVIDTGIEFSNAEFTGRVSPDSEDINTSRDSLAGGDNHGSEVAAVIAANYNNHQTVGLAFDATILAVRADDGSDGFTETDLASALDYERTHGAKVINLSLGSTSTTSAVLQAAIQRATTAGVILVFSAGNGGNSGETDPEYPGYLATNSTVSNGLIMIAGGLNSDGTFNTTSNPAGTAANWYLTAPGWQIVVPEFGTPDPKFEVCSTGANGAVCQVQGTSYAAPQVTAAAALIMQAFPGLSPAQVVNLLFTTADDTGAPGTDNVDGRGRLNIGRAFQPVGNLAAPISAKAAASPSTPMGVIGPAFGDGLTRQAGVWSIASFDRFGRTFPMNLAGNWTHAAAAPGLDAEAPQLWRNASSDSGMRVQMGFAAAAPPQSYRSAIDRQDLQQTPTRIDADLGRGLSMTFAANGVRTMYNNAPENVGHLDFVNAASSVQLTQRLNGFARLSLLSESGETSVGVDHDAIARPPTQRAATAARASFDFGGVGLDVTYGVVSEQDALLGLSWSNQLGDMPSGHTQFAGFGGHAAAGLGWRVNWDAEYGVADLANIGWLHVAEPLHTSAYAFEAEHDLTPAWLGRKNASGILSFSISQPLRVDGGAFSFMAPTATKYGLQSLRFQQRTIDPSPSGRELRFGLGYRYLLGDAFTAFAEATYVTEPGHVAEAAPASLLQFGFRLAD